MRKIIKNKIDSLALNKNIKNRFLKSLLKKTNLWHINKTSCSNAMAIGMFWSAQPMPFQMVPSSIMAYFFNANLPITLACVWLSNPITMAPLMFFNYLIGCWLLNVQTLSLSSFEIDFGSMNEWLTLMSHIWQPLFLGSAVVGITLSVMGYVGILLAWRIHLINKIRKRKRNKNKIKQQ